MAHLPAVWPCFVCLIRFSVVSAQPRTAGPVRVSVSDDRKTAVVHVKHGQRDHVYHIEAASVFAEGAEIISHTDQGEERVRAPAVTMFRAVGDGERATATIHADGSVTGLFEHEDAVLRVSPSHKPQKASQRGSRSLREDPMSSVAAGTGEAAHMHDFSYLPPLDLLGRSRQTPRRRLHGEDTDIVASSSDTSRRLQGGDDPLLIIDRHKEFMPEDQRSDLPSDETPNMTKWAGEHWHPGCYPNDDTINEFQVGVVLDNEAWKKHSEDVQEHITEAVAQASFVFEKQMHIRIKIGEFKIFKSASGAPAYAVGCPSANLMQTKLSQLRLGSGYSFMGSTHLFTGCGTDFSVVGLAYLGTICNANKYNTAVNQIHDHRSENTFLIFAHELGHNFGGDHSFEEGHGNTGGIMDYGDGHLDGVYQFNTRYRKAEMCDVMNRRAGKCQGKFGSEHGQVKLGSADGQVKFGSANGKSLLLPAAAAVAAAALLCVCWCCLMFCFFCPNVCNSQVRHTAICRGGVVVGCGAFSGSTACISQSRQQVVPSKIRPHAQHGPLTTRPNAQKPAVNSGALHTEEAGAQCTDVWSL